MPARLPQLKIALFTLISKHTVEVVVEELVEELGKLVVENEDAMGVAFENVTKVVMTTKLIVVGGVVEVEENSASFFVVNSPAVSVSDRAKDVEVAEDIVVEIGFVASVGYFSVVSLVVVSRSAIRSFDVVCKSIFVVISDFESVILRVDGLDVCGTTSF